jgi:hypothetical protein
MVRRLGQGVASVYLTVTWELTETIGCGVYSVGAVVSENLNGYMTWEGHQMNRCPGKSSIGSSDATFFSGR